MSRAIDDLEHRAHLARELATERRLHRLRLRAKVLQQAFETYAVSGDPRAAKVASSAEKLQRRLGSAHDAAVASEWLNSLAQQHGELRAHLEELARYEESVARVRRRGWKKNLDAVQRDVKHFSR